MQKTEDCQIELNIGSVWFFFPFLPCLAEERMFYPKNMKFWIVSLSILQSKINKICQMNFFNRDGKLLPNERRDRAAADVIFRSGLSVLGINRVNFVTFSDHRAKMYWNMIWKNTGFVSFGANLTKFGTQIWQPCHRSDTTRYARLG